MRKKDKFLQFLTYFSSALSVLVLGSLLLFLITKGIKLINLDLITNPYWSQNYLGAPYESENAPYELTEEIDGSYSERWGIALKDEVTAQKENIIVVTYIHPQSPFKRIESTGSSNLGETLQFDKENRIEKIDFVDDEDNINIAGKIVAQNAEEVVASLEDAKEIKSIYYKSKGGGIYSGLITTLYLIGIALFFALPLGVGSAIYLHEYASKNKLNRWIRYGIETLTGIPSIIYGLMGVSVLFPITQLVGATTTSILLGGLTMAIILLPVIMRSTEEALLVVPQSLRDGSYSLGATQFQTIIKVVIPCAVNGILTGVLLSIGRVIGESAALIYTMGTFINDSPKLLDQGTSLSLMIWSFMSQEQPNFELASAISLLILFIVFILNFSVKFIGKKFAKKVA